MQSQRRRTSRPAGLFGTVVAQKTLAEPDPAAQANEGKLSLRLSPGQGEKQPAGERQSTIAQQRSDALNSFVNRSVLTLGTRDELVENSGKTRTIEFIIWIFHLPGC